MKVRCSACPANEDRPTSDHLTRGITCSYFPYPNRRVWPSLVRELECLVLYFCHLVHTCEEYYYRKFWKKNCHVDDRRAQGQPQARGRLHPNIYPVPSFLTQWNHKVDDARAISISLDARIVTARPGMYHDRRRRRGCLAEPLIVSPNVRAYTTVAVKLLSGTLSNRGFGKEPRTIRMLCPPFHGHHPPLAHS